MTYRHTYSFEYESQVGFIIGAGFVCCPVNQYSGEDNSPFNLKLYLNRYDFLDTTETTSASFFYQAYGAVKIEYEF